MHYPFSTRRANYLSQFNGWIDYEDTLVLAGGMTDIAAVARLAAITSANRAGLQCDTDAVRANALAGGEPYAVWA